MLRQIGWWRTLGGVNPPIEYAKSGDVHIAYQVVGDGPVDLVIVLGWVLGFEHLWTETSARRFLEQLASRYRVILFDKRGTGLSDRVSNDDLPDLETRMDDVRAVMDAAGSERAVLFGISEGGPMICAFAASHPERAEAVIMHGAFARLAWAVDHLWGMTDEDYDEWSAAIDSGWGSGEFMRWFLDEIAPSITADERVQRWWIDACRRSASPGAAIAAIRMAMQIDVRDLLSAVHVPTLVLTPRGGYEEARSRYLAERIKGAELVVFDGVDHVPWAGEQDKVVAEFERFLSSLDEDVDPDRVLATVLFTDIVGSTEHAVELGDRKWRALIDDHHARVRSQIARYRGREVDTAGDGFFATFDGPARAIRCACAIRESVGELGLEIRAGLHTGECELAGDSVRGIAVHIGARVASHAAPGEVLVSSTVRDLVAGSGLCFDERGARTLKGVPEAVRLYAVVPSVPAAA